MKGNPELMESILVLIFDALPPWINKTIANAGHAVKIEGYTSGILKNRIDKAKVNICGSY